LDNTVEQLIKSGTFNAEDIRIELNRQLKSDLNRAGLAEVEFEACKSVNDYLEQLTMIIQKSGNEELARWLYLVDLNENASSNEVSNHLSMMILKRELQKVVLKRTFSKKS
jgi:hypothetical protein